MSDRPKPPEGADTYLDFVLRPGIGIRAIDDYDYARAELAELRRINGIMRIALSQIVAGYDIEHPEWSSWDMKMRASAALQEADNAGK